MCLILFAHQAHPAYRLVLAANRDEFHARPTAATAFWEDEPEVLAGRDLESGGTWLGVTRSGRWAAVTNVRDGAGQPVAERSRGHLVSGFLTGTPPPDEYVRRLIPDEQRYGGYNLLVGNGIDVVWTSNRRPAGEPPMRRLSPGVYGVSNHLLDTPWPKVERGKAALASALGAGSPPTSDRLLDILLDRAYAADHDLPTTGVPHDLERALSASFIVTPDYGTRSSTALLIERDGRIHLTERRFGPAGDVTGEDRFEM